ncbi:MAG: 2-amino-4-hydroxy-6-hydroxymethyldihydropteridine diphosphokinase, partial [bacterium]
LIINTPDLTVPHPRFQERLFVLMPLLEIEPDLKTPENIPLIKIYEDGIKFSKFLNQSIEKF